jgi:hypothetical protein
MPAFGRGQRAGHARGACADDGDPLGCRGLFDEQLGFPAGAWVHQAEGQPAFEDLVQTGLVAGNAGVDFVGASGSRLVDEIRIGKERACHRDHVGTAGSDHFLGHRRGVDAVGGDQRDPDLSHQALGYPDEGRTRDHRGNRRNACLVPADAGVDQRCPGSFDGLGQSHDLIPGTAAFDEVEHRQAVDDDEVCAGGLAHAPHRLDGEAAAVLETAAPAVLAEIGLLGDKLVDQIAFRSHHLDAVIAGDLRETGATGVVVEGALDVVLAEFAGADRRDGRLCGRGRDRATMVGVTAGMQDLHGDLATRPMDRIGDLPVLPGLRFVFQHGGAGHDHAVLVGGNAAGDDQTHAATRPLGVERGKAGETLWRFFEAGVHRTHQNTVLQRREAEVERGEQVRISVAGHAEGLLGRVGRAVVGDQ